MYRDTLGSEEWRPLPWDVDLSAGRRWNHTNTYFEDTLYSNLWPYNSNPLWELIHETDEFQEMFMRRLRTLREEVLLAPGTSAANDWYTQRINALLDQMDPAGVTSDADLDYAKWGSWGNLNNARSAAARTLSQWLPSKRSYLFSSSRNLRGTYVPAAQPVLPSITIETVDSLPASGNQDEEYFVLKNRESMAIDISGWTISGAVEYTFPAGTVIPAGAGNLGDDYIGLLHVARSAKAFRARSDTVSGGQYRYVQGGYSGQLSAWGETIEFRNRSGDLVASKTYAGTPTDAQRYLRITEIMYHPQANSLISSDAQDFEYVELRNLSDSVTLDLTGIQFTEGIRFDFTGSAVTSLLPGEYVIVAGNRLAFEAHYGAGLPVAGEFYGSLDNSGERLRLEDAVGEKVLDFEYNDSWLPITDGPGFSLALVDGVSDWTLWDAANWRVSGHWWGTPGTSAQAGSASPVLVNEVLAHTDLPDVDAIELYNPGDSPVHVGGWYLTDDFNVPQKFRIPDGTWVAAGGYLVFDESDFAGGSTGFRLSEYGDQAYLFSGDGSVLTGYHHGWDFKDSPNGVTIGRFIDTVGETHRVLLAFNTLGTANSLPLVGPIVVSEIHYHPPDYVGAVDNADDEFIELTNISSASVPLYSTDTSVPGYGTQALNDTWRLRNAVDFDFPTGVSLDAGESILVVGFDPAVEPTQLAAFRAKYAVPETVRIFGPWSGKLDNSGEELELKWPGKADALEGFYVPYYMAEEIDYRDAAPWPVAADGLGPSLERRALDAFANEAINWRATYPQGAVAPDSDNDQIPDWWEHLYGLSVGLNDAALDPDGDGRSNMEESISGTDPLDASSHLELKILFQDDTRMTYGFGAVADLEYTVQFTSDLSVDWQVWQQVSASSVNAIVEFDVTPSASGFYRVVTPPVE